MLGAGPGNLSRDAAEALAAARARRAGGDIDAARATLVRAVLAGAWNHSPLWIELVSLMESEADYGAIHDLWRDAPESARDTVPIIRHVARAACMAGFQEEGRELLRRAILRAEARRTTIALRRAYVGTKRWAAKRFTSGSGFARKAESALVDLRNELTQLGLRPFLISGTLLGHVREGGFISWDKDIDVGVFVEKEHIPQLETSLSGTRSFRIKRHDLKSNRIALHHHRGIAIDVFPHYRVGDVVWHDGAATRWWNTPFDLKTDTFLGVEQYVPSDPERYLDENYGDWRTPQSFFDSRLDAPNAEVTDPAYLMSLHYFSLLNAVRAGNKRAIARYAGIIAETETGGWAADFLRQA